MMCYHRALQSIENIAFHKEQSISQKAKDIATGAGESDLRRLKRQFASLKNTYMLYDTKEHFLDGVHTVPDICMHTQEPST